VLEYYTVVSEHGHHSVSSNSINAPQYRLEESEHCLYTVSSK